MGDVWLYFFTGSAMIDYMQQELVLGIEYSGSKWCFLSEITDNYNKCDYFIFIEKNRKNDPTSHLIYYFGEQLPDEFLV